MYYGTITKREIQPDSDKVTLVKEMVSELLDEYTPVFDTTEFIVHENDGELTVGMKWQ